MSHAYHLIVLLFYQIVHSLRFSPLIIHVQ